MATTKRPGDAGYWDEVVTRLNASKTGAKAIKMGSPGSAQVTRCRLLKAYRGLKAYTRGATLHLEVAR